MQIELRGLTQKQIVFCDVMWSISTREGVESFIRTLPKDDQRTCHNLVELMQLAFSDKVETIDPAVTALLDRIAK
jgi:hypothetical protein